MVDQRSLVHCKMWDWRDFNHLTIQVREKTTGAVQCLSASLLGISCEKVLEWIDSSNSYLHIESDKMMDYMNDLSAWLLISLLKGKTHHWFGFGLNTCKLYTQNLWKNTILKDASTKLKIIRNFVSGIGQFTLIKRLSWVRTGCLQECGGASVLSPWDKTPSHPDENILR